MNEPVPLTAQAACGVRAGIQTQAGAFTVNSRPSDRYKQTKSSYVLTRMFTSGVSWV